MSDISIKLDVAKARSVFSQLGKSFDTTKILKLIGIEQLGWVDRNFEEEGTERPWKPLKLSTVLNRRKGSHRILQDTGELKKSLSPTRGVLRHTSSYITVGSVIKYAATHHYGSRERNIPARPILPSERATNKLVKNFMTAYLEKAVRDARV